MEKRSVETTNCSFMGRCAPDYLFTRRRDIWECLHSALCDDKTPGSPSPDPLYNLYSCNLNKQGLICLLESFYTRQITHQHLAFGIIDIRFWVKWLWSSCRYLSAPSPIQYLWSTHDNQVDMLSGAMLWQVLMLSSMARELQAGLDHCSVDAEFEKETELKVI